MRANSATPGSRSSIPELRNGGEQRPPTQDVLIGLVARRRMEYVRLPFADRIETHERGHELAGSVQLDGQLPFRCRRDSVGEPLCAGSESWEVLGPCRDEVPFTQSPTDAWRLAWMLRRAGARGLLLVLIVVFAASGQRDRCADACGTGKKCSAVRCRNSLN